MKIVVITGSPHRNGTSAYLTDEFIRGAKEAGHEIERFDGAFLKVHPCIACEKCHTGSTGCVFKDDMLAIHEALIGADAVVLSSHIYYYGINAQLKTILDRVYARNEEIRHGKQAALLLTMADDITESAESSEVWFRNYTKYMDWENAGVISAINSWTKDALLKTDFPEKAYQLGKGF